MRIKLFIQIYFNKNTFKNLNPIFTRTQLLDAHNGTIWCNSKPEKGSSFYVAVPLANEMSNFLLDFKQNLQKAKINNSSLSMVKIKGEKELIQNLLNEKSLINKSYLNNSIQEIEDNMTTLTMVIQEGDKFSANFLKKKLEEYMKSHGNLYPNCAILYSYGVYPEDSLEEEELIKKVQESFTRIVG